MLTWGLMPLGALPLGLVADQIGIRAATIAGAAITIALTILLSIKNREIFRL